VLGMVFVVGGGGMCLREGPCWGGLVTG
jgi:hypothetical protein